MVALVDGSPRVLNLKQILKYYVDFRVDIVTKRAEFDLKKAQARIHILEGLRVALQNIDEVVETIKSAGPVEEAREALKNRFDLSEIQAQAILDMQLRRIAALETEKIESEYIDYTIEYTQFKGSIPRILVAKCCIDSLKNKDSINKLIEVTSSNDNKKISFKKAMQMI